jgi:hypothetical protein
MVGVGIERGNLLTGADKADYDKENARYPKSSFRAFHLFKILDLAVLPVRNEH